MSTFQKRLLTGLFCGIFFLYLLFSNKWGYTIALLFLGFIALGEILYAQFKKLNFILYIIGIWLFILCFNQTLDIDKSLLTIYQPFLLPFEGIISFSFIQLSFINMIYTLIGALLLINVFSLNKINFTHISQLFFSAIYLGVSFGAMAKSIHLINGLKFCMGVIVMTWINDTLAYIIGYKFGRKPFFPKISPKKTWEGTIAGFIGAMVLGFILYLNWSVLFPLWFITIVALISPLGDLIQSAWKRTLNIKDFGVILPGHGGILDRFDSLLFIFFVLYLLGVI